MATSHQWLGRCSRPNRSHINYQQTRHVRAAGYRVDGSVATVGVDVCVEFRTERMAMHFEKYLKSGAAFAERNRADEGWRKLW